MTARIPNRGEKPYYDVLREWLKVSHNDDGTQKATVALTSAKDTKTAIGGQTNTVNFYIKPVATGTVQEAAFWSRIDGIADGGSSVFRIAGVFEAQTGGGTGANGIDGLNVVVQQNVADDVAYVAGLELAFNNLKRNDPLDPVDQNHYGITIDAYGGFSIGPAALAVRKAGGAGSTWQRGVWAPEGSITPSTGYFLDYAGDGAGRKFQVDAAGNVFVGSHLKFPTTSVAPSSGMAIYNNGGIAFTFVSGTDSFRWFSNNLGAELMRLSNAGELGLGGISTSTWFLSKAGTTARSSLRVPHGSAPTSPVDGDIWTTTAGLFVRVNGVTVGPLS